MVSVREATESSVLVIDVDGSYLQQQLSSAGITPAPSPPITGWESVTSGNVSIMMPKSHVLHQVHCVLMTMLTSIHNVVYTCRVALHVFG